MQDDKVINYIKDVLANMPKGWLDITTHRLDIYNEALAKIEFTEAFENLYNTNNVNPETLDNLPTAYDYIRLGHPLSCILEWSVAQLYHLNSKDVISFSSQTTPILAVLRKNLLDDRKTLITYTDALPDMLNIEVLRSVYGYNTFEVKKVENTGSISEFEGSTIFISNHNKMDNIDLNPNIDFYINLYPNLGSIIITNGAQNEDYISDIQHVRRRETIAMTPANCLVALNALASESTISYTQNHLDNNKSKVQESIKTITGTTSKPLVGSSGLSIQYAIMMGLIDDALKHHPRKSIKFLVPPNCYGGTNDQARRIAACLDNVEILDLPVDGDNDMVQSIDRVLAKVAYEDAVPYIIAEIPTNPRVEVPDLEQLKAVLIKERQTADGQTAIDPVFILDQTFCPNIHFLREGEMLSSVRSISYASGSKFPSGGKCTAGYCVTNKKAEGLLHKIEQHLLICDNEATALQYEILAEQLPTMNQRIAEAYKNTREFVTFIEQTLPEANINFVSEELAELGFTPSVFSLDLPTKGDTAEEKEAYKRALNHKLIHLMITEIPSESKYCVSYGQIKGCYWTIPATSTQGTTKEGDKDYIARVAVSPNLNLEKHKAVFSEFVKGI